MPPAPWPPPPQPPLPPLRRRRVLGLPRFQRSPRLSLRAAGEEEWAGRAPAPPAPSQPEPSVEAFAEGEPGGRTLVPGIKDECRGRTQRSESQHKGNEQSRNVAHLRSWSWLASHCLAQHSFLQCPSGMDLNQCHSQFWNVCIFTCSKRNTF